MKRFTITLLLYFVVSSMWAQQKSSIVFKGDAIMLPSIEHFYGGGYMLAYQKNLKGNLFLESGGSYEIAMTQHEGQGWVNGFELLTTSYHHAAYSFFSKAVYKFQLSDNFSIALISGPVACYQSNVYDKYHYDWVDTRENVWIRSAVYANQPKEGLYFGGIAGLRVSYAMKQNWSVLAETNAKGIINAESSFSAGVGIGYSW